MSYEIKKRVIGLKNPTFQARKENSDDVGIDQAPDFHFAFCKIAVGIRKRQPALLLGFEEARVFDGYCRLIGEGLDERDLFVRERSKFLSPYENYSNGHTFAQ